MSKSILIVDDELDFIELLRYRLRDWGYKIHEAGNGTDALNKTWAHMPDLILLDLLLPDLDGLTLTEILQRQDSTRHIPIIMMSALGSNVTQVSAQIAGVRDSFSKPVDFERLRSRIDSLTQPQEIAPPLS